jgi:hypothetical protein
MNSALITNQVAGSLTSSGVKGQAAPAIAQAIGVGIASWLPTVIVQTTDTGTLGVGRGYQDFQVPLGTLMAGLLISFAGNGLLGSMAPLEAMGLAQGIAAAFQSAKLVTNHAGVGSGVGVVRLIARPAFNHLRQAFVDAGIKGPLGIKKAQAVSDALVYTFGLLSPTIQITGGASSVPGSGSGVGKIV